MLANGLVSTYKEEVVALHRFVLYYTNKVSEMVHYWFSVTEQLYQDINIGFNWLQHFNYSLTGPIML